MSYRVKEIFYTLQGEGHHAGRPAVFLRFSNCNLWTGHEKDRATAICQFCDTDFVGGMRYDLEQLVVAISDLWPSSGRGFVVCTGGEPLLQLDVELISELHDWGFDVAVETNGTILAPSGIDWVCVSPKANAPFRETRGDELKLVYPQPGLMPSDLPAVLFRELRLQPMDGPDREANTQAAVQYCLDHPQWSLSLQTHKTLGLR